MFIDASALTRILANELDRPDLLARIERAQTRLTSPLAVWETTIAIARILGIAIPEATDAVEWMLAIAEIDIIAIAPEKRAIAIGAFDRFGKARHPAALNFGDYFAYACARHARVALLFKGVDFSQTDIAPA
jgi:ribonuclease VapC